MKQLLFLFPLCFVLLITSCEDDTEVLPQPDVTNLTLDFKAMYGEGELDFNGTSYDYNEMGLTLSRFDFFISNVSLFKNVDGVQELTELFEIDFVDFTNNNNSVSISTDEVPVGEYDGIVFSIGVPSDLNNQIPADFSTTHPLGITNLSHYWAGWNSYIFSKVEGRIDDINFTYHIGTNDNYRGGITKGATINLEKEVPMNIDFTVDVENLLIGNGPLDIVSFPSSHDPDQPTAAVHIMSNFSNSISVD